ncbi:MAG: hypothetical protein E6F94_05365 [Actinobacteria bacterium]|nr:MAG: hypothetical protein E6F94_05365 [Actinomycetota bacterium]
MNARRATVLTVVGLALFLAAITLGTAAASPIKWVSVPLGTHQFGHLRSPDGIVAQAGPNEVGFKKGGTGCGCMDGPGGPVSFDVARNGSIWLFDVLNHRLLVWRSGAPAHPARTVRLGSNLDVRDFALGRDGTIYLNAVYAEPPAGDSGANLWALTPNGKLRWRAKAKLGNALRVGPNGILYSIGGARNNGAWTPLTTSAGRPLSLAAQRRQTVRFQPLAGGMHLIATQLGVHEVHFALVDSARKIVRAWRVTSHTRLALEPSALTPSFVGGELFVQLDVSRQTGPLSEHMVLGLRQSGAMQRRFSLDANALCCYDGTGASTPLRIASDGRLYQLRTNPKTGASIARYSLPR